MEMMASRCERQEGALYATMQGIYRIIAPRKMKKATQTETAFQETQSRSIVLSWVKNTVRGIKKKQANRATRKKRSREWRIPCQGEMYAVQMMKKLKSKLLGIYVVLVTRMSSATYLCSKSIRSSMTLYSVKLLGFSYGFLAQPKCIGVVELQTEVGANIFKTKLKDVLYVDEAQLNLVSHSQLEKQGLEVEYKRGGKTFKIWWKNRLTMVATLKHEEMFVRSTAQGKVNHERKDQSSN